MSFVADEVLEIAEQMERNGGRFYRAAAEKAPGRAREILLRLGEMEDRHRQIFREMRIALTPEEKVPPTTDPDNLAEKYLRSLISGKVFDYRGDPLKKLPAMDAAAEILKYAITLEKETIAFYLGIRDSMRRPADRERVDAVIEEEKAHVVELTDELDDLSGSKA